MKTLAILLCAAGFLAAQPTTTTVSDTLYMAIGGPTYCSGTITLSWNTFYSKDGYLIQGGTSAPIAVTAGVFSVAVVPTNTNNTPATGIYTAHYNIQPSGCAPATEYWNVPSSPNPANLSEVRTLPVPPPSLIPVTSLNPPLVSGIYELCFTGGVVQWGTCGGATSGITGSGTTGKLAKFTNTQVIGNAGVSDITANFTGCSGTQYLGFDGNCHTVLSQLTYSAIVSLWSGCSGTQLLGADGNCHTAGAGTVTSVGLSLPGIFSVSGSPVTSSGTLTASLASQSQNLVFASPNGSSGAPSFRALVGADLPNPSSSSLGGIQSYVAVSHQWINAISTLGVPSSTQPGFSDLSGSAACSQLPALTGDTTSSAGSCATSTGKVNGGAVPASAVALASNSSNQIVAATVQGSGDSKVMLAGTVSGTGAALCTDANGGATTSGCSGGGGVTYGTRASLPASGSSTGAVYKCTDSPYEFIWTGSAWQAYVFGFAVTEPILSNFTQVNISGNPAISLDTSHGGITWNVQTSGASQNVGYIAQAVPGSGAYDVDAAWFVAFTGGGNNGGFGMGLSAGTSASNAFAIQSWGMESCYGCYFEKEYNSTTSFNTNNQGLSLIFGGSLVWMRVRYDGSANRVWYISNNGQDWFQVYSQPYTTNFTPAYALVAPINYNQSMLATLVHFSVHT